jgi:hypothetical protein
LYLDISCSGAVPVITRVLRVLVMSIAMLQDDELLNILENNDESHIDKYIYHINALVYTHLW